MAPMIVKVLVLCLIGVVITEAACDIQIKTLDIINKPNDYFGDIVSEIKPQGNDSSLSLTIPIKKDLDEKLEMKLNLNFYGISIFKNHVVSLCDAISEDGFFNPIIKEIEYTGKFPTKCPIPAGEWKLSNYVIDPQDYFPFGLALPGDFELQLDVGMPDEEPLLVAKLTGTVILVL